jgi:hypothetical protein
MNSMNKKVTMEFPFHLPHWQVEGRLEDETLSTSTLRKTSRVNKVCCVFLVERYCISDFHHPQENGTIGRTIMGDV